MIEFILNNKKISTHCKTGENLLYFIREQEFMKGTKVGCREGDCGACTVLVGSLQKNDTVVYKTVTSCLASLASVAGKHVVTIEGLNLERDLNKAQQAMHENFATQCGFCTPGFVVSLSGHALENNIKNKNTIDAISGNICRCTGYKSIEKAAILFDQELQNSNETIEWFIENKFIPSYFRTIPELLKSLNNIDSKEKARLVAGGTDVYVKEADNLTEIDVFFPEGNNKIEFQSGKILIGGNVTVAQLWDSERLNEFFPKWKNYLKLISSKQIRNMATIAGNFVNASPIADLAILFLALDASLILKNQQKESRKVVLKDFFLAYKKIDLKENEVIETIEFEIPSKNKLFNFEKVSKRTHLDIASVNSAMSIQVEKNIIKELHLSIGGVSAVPKYLVQTGFYLIGKDLTISVIKEACNILQSEITPIDDIRGSKEYKRLLANQLFLAHFIELFPETFSLADFQN